ncbi:MAG: hypothetical protein GVY29_08735 [Spirochaetes bacterium]|jgi:hypothetical protein|nr:hypothetical protein [Spirochaetota bacterium]
MRPDRNYTVSDDALGKMRINYDPTVDVLTVVFPLGVILDYDRRGELVSIEFSITPQSDRREAC